MIRSGSFRVGRRVQVPPHVGQGRAPSPAPGKRCSRTSSRVTPPHREPNHSVAVWGAHPHLHAAPLTKSTLRSEQPAPPGPAGPPCCWDAAGFPRASLHTPSAGERQDRRTVTGRQGQGDLGPPHVAGGTAAGAASLQNGLDAPQKVPHGVAVWPSNPTPRRGPTRTERTSTQMLALECSRQRGCSRQKLRQPAEPAGLSWRGVGGVPRGLHGGAHRPCIPKARHAHPKSILLPGVPTKATHTSRPPSHHQDPCLEAVSWEGTLHVRRRFKAPFNKFIQNDLRTHRPSSSS